MLISLLAIALILSISLILVAESQNQGDTNNNDDFSINLPYLFLQNGTNQIYTTRLSINSTNGHCQMLYLDENSQVVKIIDLTKIKYQQNGYGYWLWASDMYDVDLDQLSDQGVRYIFLQSTAFNQYGQRDVIEWVKKANDHGIEVHIWMQVFYQGDWSSPVSKNGTINNALFNQKIEEARYYARLDGISGIQLDYLRFEGTANQYNNSTESINTFVKKCCEEIRKINPGLTISATVMPETSNNPYYYGQDVATIGNYVDVICPMIYKGNYEQNTSWIKNITEWYVNNSNASIWCGLQSYRSDFNISELPLDEISRDASQCYDGGAENVIIFRWGMNDELDKKGLRLL